MSNLLKLGRVTLRQVSSKSVLISRPLSTNQFLFKEDKPSKPEIIKDSKPVQDAKTADQSSESDSTIKVTEKVANDLYQDSRLKHKMLVEQLETDDDFEIVEEFPWEELKPEDLTEFNPILDFPDDPYFAKHTHTQKFPLENRYPSQPPPQDTIIEEKEEVEFSHSMGINHRVFRSLKKKVLHVRRTVNMTAKGKLPSMWALVVVGNGDGVGGYGEAKADDVGVAVQKATQRAIKNMVAFERYDSRTIYHDIEHKFKATNLKLFARPPGFGLRINMYLHEICECLGFRDLSGKVYGSANPMNVVKAFFEAIQKQKTPQDIAKSRGKKLVDVQYRYYGIDS